MNRVRNLVALLDQPIPSIGKTDGAANLGVFELTAGEVQKLPQLLAEARENAEKFPEALRCTRFFEAISALVELITQYQTQYVEVWVSNYADWRECPGRVFARVFPPREFRR